MPRPTTAPGGAAALSALDWIAALLALLLAGGLPLFAFVYAPGLRGMFAEFGGPLPPLTRLALSPWPALLLCAAALASVAAGAGLRRGAPGLRRALIVAGFFVALLGLGLHVAAVYLPIVQLSGAIRP